MLAIQVSRNRVLDLLLPLFPQLREQTVLVELKKSKSMGLKENQIYFPIDCFLSSVTPTGVDCAVMGSEHCTWVGPHKGLFICRVPGHAYQIPIDCLDKTSEILIRQSVRYHISVMSMLSYFCNHMGYYRLLYYLSLFPYNCELEITQEELGAAIGVRRETITENFKSLIDCGIIEHTRGRIMILDSDKIIELVQEED